MIFQKKVDRSFEKLHEEKLQKDGHLTEEEIEQEKEKLEWRDYVAMTVSALLMILPVALLALGLLALAGYFFLVH